MATKKKAKKKTKSKSKRPIKAKAKAKAKKPAKKSAKRPAKKAVKKAAKKTAKKAAPRKKAPARAKKAPPPAVPGTLLGRVEDFFAQINVIALTLQNDLSVGNSIHIKGHTTDRIEPVTSIQIDHEAVMTAKKGDSVGIKISDVARHGDWVFRVD